MRSVDIFQRVREFRARPANRDMTEREALSLLSRRCKRRSYGRTKVGNFSATIEQPRYAWQDRAGGDL